MSLWSFQTGIIWSFYKGRLYTARMREGMAHESLHVKHSLPITGAAFDAVERGRALFTDKAKFIEVVSTGRHEHISNQCYGAILKHFGHDPQATEVTLLEPNWDREPINTSEDINTWQHPQQLAEPSTTTTFP